MCIRDRAASAEAAESKDGKEKSLLERLHHEKKTAHEIYEKDMEELARAQLKMKGLTGVEGIDAVSRTQVGGALAMCGAGRACAQRGVAC
eukprot:3121995-Rhodomonas_salina.1